MAGLGRAPVVRCVPRPWLEAGDTINVGFAGGPTEAQLIDTVTTAIGDPVAVQTVALVNDEYTIFEPVREAAHA
jgi:hypothetical protein